MKIKTIGELKELIKDIDNDRPCFHCKNLDKKEGNYYKPAVSCSHFFII